MASDGSDGNVGNDRNKHLGYFGITTAILLCCLIVGCLAYISGRETERRDQTPAAYSDAAKNKAQQDCVRLEGDATFDCIYEKVKASQEQARSEQDLDAQQRSANGAAITAILAIIGLAVSIIGIGLVWSTFRVAHKSNIIAQTALDLESRPFVIPDGQIAHSMPEELGKIWVEFAYINIGKAPAFTIESSVTRDSEFGPYADTKEASPTILFDKARYVHNGRSFFPNTHADVELLIKYRSVMNGKIYTTAAKGVIFPTHHAEKTEVNCVRWVSIVCEEQ